MKLSLILLAGGSSERFNGNKLFSSVNGITLLERALGIATFYPFYEVIVVCREVDLDMINEISARVGVEIKTVFGGKTRGESAYRGLKAASGDYVLLHDCARAFVEKELVLRVIQKLKGEVGVVPVIGETDSLICTDGRYLDREKVKHVQTPQGFYRAELIRLFDKYGFSYTDEGSLWAKEHTVTLVDGDKNNIKVTYPEDIYNMTKAVRVGNGFDFHSLVEGRRLILCGVDIPFSKGLLGHSDADAPVHALCDAILNALALGDIGRHFPDTDMRYKDIDSILLLKEVISMAKAHNARVYNASLTILAEKPKLSKYISQMTNNIAEVLNISPSMVGIGATTTEGLGLIGREEGIACYASVTMIEEH